MPTANMSRATGLYASAVALNNMGVSLIDKGAYKEAVHTLKDAVKVLQVVTSGQPVSPDVENGVQQLLQRASRQVCLSTNVADNAEQLVLCYDRGVTTSGTGHVFSKSMERIFAICIEDETDDLEQSEVDIHSAIVLQNLAVAHLHILETENDDQQARKVHNSAIEIAVLACNILAKVSNESQNTEYTLGMVALTCLFRNLLAAGRLQEAEDTLRRLYSLKIEEERASALLFPSAKPAAAA